MKPRNTSPFIIVLALASSSFITGCGTVEETVYLNDLSVRGPVTQPAVHLTDANEIGQFHISPRASVIPKRSLESRIEGNIYTGSYNSWKGNNFHWSLPSAQFGVDMDYLVSDRFALSGGMDYAPTGVGDFTAGYVSVGFPFFDNVLSGRFEVGARIQTMWYDAYSVLVREETSFFTDETNTTVSYFHDVSRASTWNMFTTLTFNTHGDGFVHFFCSAAVSRQTLTDFQPTTADVNAPTFEYHQTDMRAEQTATVLSFAPGLVFSVGSSVKVLAGARILWPAGVGDNIPPQVVPLIQFDMAL